ncbi:methyltransferase family protein [Roseisolibacter agri]|uniref:Isoprenylcysteine carboxyl methyltransferase (ICMT) family protein n=1 Tax=Roseisolibacter agri TaxID=2014610 RepID=A0AA37QBC6_9BACT|nr:isoprenylcysteine carboxylmethyltransferase family protein [Roseisolibacter agri]GLC23538.1 hypothetical protein rosag_00510 [Roseisolibacter agri]
MWLWLRAALFVLVVPGTVGGWLPWWLGCGRTDAAPLPARALAVPALALGWGVLLWCVRDFVRRGRGTPAPYDPPAQLVTGGLYEHVRNPMYVGVLLATAGWALWCWSTRVLAYWACVAVAFHTVVTLFEEPALARTFGASYDGYRSRVPRWIPRWRSPGP